MLILATTIIGCFAISLILLLQIKNNFDKLTFESKFTVDNQTSNVGIV